MKVKVWSPNEVPIEYDDIKMFDLRDSGLLFLRRYDDRNVAWAPGGWDRMEVTEP